MIKAKTIIFDLDGTLWDSTEASLTGWNEAAVEKAYLKDYRVTRQTLMDHFGLTIDKIMESLLPDLNKSEQEEFIDAWIENSHKIIESKQGTHLFGGVVETLTELKKDHSLYIVSNCEAGYIDSFYQAHELKQFFDDYECWGRTKLTKSGSILTLMKRNKIKDAAYVGDTLTDEIAAHEAGIPFVFASYGFGKSENYEACIKNFCELKDIFRN